MSAPARPPEGSAPSPVQRTTEFAPEFIYGANSGNIVAPAEAGAQSVARETAVDWIPAFAGMTMSSDKPWICAESQRHAGPMRFVWLGGPVAVVAYRDRRANQ